MPHYAVRKLFLSYARWRLILQYGLHIKLTYYTLISVSGLLYLVLLIKMCADISYLRPLQDFQKRHSQVFNIIECSLNSYKHLSNQTLMWQRAYADLQQDHSRLLSSFYNLHSSQIDVGQLVLENARMEQRIKVLENSNTVHDCKDRYKKRKRSNCWSITTDENYANFYQHQLGLRNRAITKANRKLTLYKLC